MTPEEGDMLVQDFRRILRKPKYTPGLRRGHRIYQVLRSHPGRVFSEDFLATLIARKEGGGLGSVPSTISYLRKHAPDGDRIISLEGAGYVWRP